MHPASNPSTTSTTSARPCLLLLRLLLLLLPRLLCLGGGRRRPVCRRRLGRLAALPPQLLHPLPLKALVLRLRRLLVTIEEVAVRGGGARLYSGERSEGGEVWVMWVRGSSQVPTRAAGGLNDTVLWVADWMCKSTASCAAVPWVRPH